MDTIKILDFKMKIPNSNTDGIFMKLRNQKIWEPKVTNEVVRNFDKIDCFVDVGANIGYYTLLAKSRNVDVTYSFEPDETNFKILNDNIKLNEYQNCRTYNIGLGEKQQISTFNFRDSKSGHGTFLNNTKRLMNLDKQKEKMIKALDSFDIKSENIGMKIDVEGYEYEVLRGSKNILNNNKVSFIVMEISRKFYGIEKEKKILNFLNGHFENVVVIQQNKTLSKLPNLEQYDIIAVR